MILKDNGISRVELRKGLIYKTQPKHLTDNEIWCLEKLAYSGYVPLARQISIDTIEMEFIKETSITDLEAIIAHFVNILSALQDAGIRHGDLTEANILIKDNHPYVIDFSESRLHCDPRPDKRPEGDKYWLKRTLKQYGT